jgi:hypothetical protein
LGEIQTAWVAGYLEGEGCFFWITYQTEKYGPYHYPRIACSSTDRDVLEQLAEYTGVGRVWGPQDRGPNKPIWHWTVSKGKEAAALMRALYPYMGQRRRAKIDEVLAFVEKGRE